MARSPSPFSFLWQALLLPSKNPKLFSNIFFIYITINSLLYIGHQLSAVPLASKLSHLAKLLPTIGRKNLDFTELLNTTKTVTKELPIVEIVYYVSLFVTSSFLSIITYHANSTTYLGDVLTMKELLNKVKGKIKGPVITQLWVALLCLSFPNAFAIIRSEISLQVSNYSKISAWLFLTWILLKIFLSVYLAAFSAMAVAISVIEPNVYGLGATMHASRLLKGKMKQVLLLGFALTIAYANIYATNYNTMTTKFAFGLNPGTSILGFVCQLLQQVIAFYSMMAVTVLYYECIQSNEGAEYTTLDSTTSLA